MKKLLFINRFFHPDISATSQLLSDLVFSMGDDECDIEIVCSRLLYTDPTAKPLPLQETIDGVHIKRLRTTRLGKRGAIYRLLDYLTFYIAACWYLLFNIRKNTIVITKTDPPLLSIPVSLIAKIRRAKVVNWYQDVFPEVAQAAGIKIGNDWTTAKLMGAVRWLRNRSLKSSMATVVLSESMRQHMLKCGVPENTLHIIPNWSNLNDVQPILSKDSEFREHWNLSGQFIVGYSGNLGIAHEFDTLLGAANLLRDEKDITFVIIGGGQRRNAAVTAVKALELEDKVIFKPYQARASLAHSLGIADVHLISLLPAMEGLVVPSKFYGITAAARPSIYIGDINSEMAELLKNKQCGCSVNVNDSSALAEQILDYYNNPARCRTEGQNALAVSHSHYTPEQAKNAWRTLLLEGSKLTEQGHKARNTDTDRIIF